MKIVFSEGAGHHPNNHPKQPVQTALSCKQLVQSSPILTYLSFTQKHPLYPNGHSSSHIGLGPHPGPFLKILLLKTTTPRSNSQINDAKKMTKQARKTKQRSSSFKVCCPKEWRQNHLQVRGAFPQCSPMSLFAEFTADTSITVTTEQTLKQEECDYISLQSSLTPSTTQKAPPTQGEQKKITTSEKHCMVPWQHSRMRGIKIRKTISFMGKKSFSGKTWKAVSKANCSQGQILSSEAHSWEEIDNASWKNNSDHHYNSASRKRYGSHSNDSKYMLHSSISISDKYQPKLFQDIAGNEIIIEAISNAVQKKKIARLYLFHGPRGNGKTSTARIFAMALNCESISDSKPCWTCTGCSRSLYIIELCFGSRITGFERIKTLLKNKSFTQAIPGFKVLVIEECQSFTTEAWDELLAMIEGSYDSNVVFVLITLDASLVPRTISSRSQKFFFPKLKDIDIRLKLARIVAQENIGIEREALNLIVAKAEGSLREAENILDHLTLLGPRITSSTVQQLVGLIPHDKLTNLLATAISGDIFRTIKFTRALIATGVEPQALASQLASIITDILSDDAFAIPNSSLLAAPSNDKTLLRSRSKLTNTQSEKLCHALKTLIETEKQPKTSIDQTMWIFGTLLKIASEDVSNREPTGTILPGDTTLSSGDKPMAVSVDMQRPKRSHNRTGTEHQPINRTFAQPDMDRTDPRKTTKNINETKKYKGKAIERQPNFACMSNVDEIWLNILERIQSRYIKEFLSHQAKIASLTVSNANAIVHLMFEKSGDKLAAQMSEESISRALKIAIGCPVVVNISLEPVDLEIIQENTISSITNELVGCSHSRQQKTPILPGYIDSGNTGAGAHCSTHEILAPSSENSLRPTKLKFCSLISEVDKCQLEKKEAATTLSQRILPFPELLKQKNQLDDAADPKTSSLIRVQASIDTAYNMRTNNLKHRCLSLSSFQQSDASIEPYSQDILFENAETEKRNRMRRNLKQQRSLSKASNNHHSPESARTKGLQPSWSCTDILCQRKTR